MRIRGKSMEAWNGAAAAYNNVEQGLLLQPQHFQQQDLYHE